MTTQTQDVVFRTKLFENCVRLEFCGLSQFINGGATIVICGLSQSQKNPLKTLVLDMNIWKHKMTESVLSSLQTNTRHIEFTKAQLVSNFYLSHLMESKLSKDERDENLAYLKNLPKKQNRMTIFF